MKSCVVFLLLGETLLILVMVRVIDFVLTFVSDDAVVRQ